MAKAALIEAHGRIPERARLWRRAAQVRLALAETLFWIYALDGTSISEDPTARATKTLSQQG